MLGLCILCHPHPGGFPRLQLFLQLSNRVVHQRTQSIELSLVRVSERVQHRLCPIELSPQDCKLVVLI